MRPDLGGARTCRRTGRSAGWARAPGPPSHHVSHAPDLLPGRSLRRQAVGRRDVARRLIEAVYAFADGFGPASVYWLTQEYNAPGTLPVRHPRPSDIFRRLPALSLAGDSAGCGRGRRPLGRSAAYAQQRSPCLPACPRSTCPRRSASLNGRVVIAARPRSTRAAGRHVQGRVSTWPARTPSWACNGLTAVSRRVRRSTRMPAAATSKGVDERAPRCDRQRSWRCLRDRRTTGFPQIRAARAVRRPFWLDGMRVGATGG